ncbi:MAG: TolC family protein [Treponemataceae bacterium]|nr:TolC family protein [Treponemataceae bacterium]
MLFSDFFIRQKRGLAFALLAALALCAAHSQESDSKIVITIQDAVQTALENNISLKRSQIQFDAAARTKKSSWNSVSPAISMGGGFSKNNENFAENYSAYVQASIGITLSTNLYSDIKNAALRYEAGELSYETAKRSIEMNVRSAFYALLYQKENISLQEQNLETTRELYQTNQRKYSRGAISEIDVLSSQVNYERNIPLLQNAQITHDKNLALFKQMLGLEQDAQIVLSGNLDEIINSLKPNLSGKDESVRSFVEGSDAKNFELAALEKNLEIAKNSLLASRFSAYGPTISAGWSYQPTWIKTPVAGSSGPNDGGRLSLSINIPLDGLFPWSRKNLEISSAKDNIKDLQLQIEDKKTSVQVETQSAIQSIEQMSATLQTLQASERLAERTYQMTQEAYGRGTRNYTELLSAQNSLENARLSLKQQAYNIATSILNLENNLGIPFGTLLNNENSN